MTDVMYRIIKPYLFCVSRMEYILVLIMLYYVILCYIMLYYVILNDS